MKPLMFLLTLSLYLCTVKFETAAASNPWFGSRSQYRCRCTNDQCDASGQCVAGATCQKGWFGPECQYVDLVYNSQPKSAITDGDDSTCVYSSQQFVNITLNKPYPFTWMRVYLSRPDLLNNLTVQFGLPSNQHLSCNHVTVSPDTMDIYCDLTQLVHRISLIGSGASFLCSVYVSGGRNVALKQDSSQSGTYQSYDSGRSVDGGTNGDLNAGSCSHTATGVKTTPWWRVTFRQPQNINRYVIYNRNDNQEDENSLTGFVLESVDTNGDSVYNYRDTNQIGQDVYEFTDVHKSAIKSSTIYVHNNESILNLCEVELYGDAACTNGRYGKECELTCDCPGESKCFVGTGICPAACSAGYEGLFCDKACNEQKYGKNCLSSCSANCVDSVGDSRKCDSLTGTCLFGCKADYTGLLCLEPTAQQSSGDEDDITVTKFASVVSVLTVLIVVACVIIYILCRKRRQQTTQAASTFRVINLTSE